MRSPFTGVNKALPLLPERRNFGVHRLAPTYWLHRCHAGHGLPQGLRARAPRGQAQCEPCPMPVAPSQRRYPAPTAAAHVPNRLPSHTRAATAAASASTWHCKAAVGVVDASVKGRRGAPHVHSARSCSPPMSSVGAGFVARPNTATALSALAVLIAPTSREGERPLKTGSSAAPSATLSPARRSAARRPPAPRRSGRRSPSSAGSCSAPCRTS